jgi:hypothetical protein
VAGYTAGKGEPVQWTPVLREAFQGAVWEAFNRGFETGRAADATGLSV